MSALKFWAYSICCVSVVYSLYRLLLPSSSISKQTGMVMSLFLLIAMLSPLKSMRFYDPDVFFALYPQQYSQTDADELLKAQLTENISQLVEEKLEQYGIIAGDIRIDIIVTPQSIDITSIDVRLEEEFADKQKLERELTEYLQIKTTVSERSEEWKAKD